MSITIQLPSGEHVSLDNNNVLIGSESGSDVVISDQNVQSQHARIRKMAGRWMVESLGDWLIQAGDSEAGKTCWIQPTDEIRLSPTGPVLVFQPKPTASDKTPETATSVPAAAPPALPQESETAVENWHYSIGGNQNGPVSFEELKRLAAASKLSPSDLIWREGDKDWQPAGSVANLLSVGTPQSQDRVQRPPLPSQAPKKSPQATPNWNGRRGKTPPPIPSRRRPPSFLNATPRKDHKKIDPTARKRKWYYAEGTEKRGPVSFRQLGQLVAERKLGPSDWVWNSSLDEWNPACEIEDLSTKLHSARSATAAKQLPTPKSPASLSTKAALAKETIETLDAETATVSEMAKGQIVTPKRLAIGGVIVLAIAVSWGVSFFFGAGDNPNSVTQDSGTASHFKAGDKGDGIQPTQLFGDDLPSEFSTVRKVTPDIPLKQMPLQLAAEKQLSSVRSFRFSRNGGFFLLNSEEDNSKSPLRMWNVVSGKEVTTRASQDTSFTSPAALSPDETQLVCIDGELLHVWNMTQNPATLTQTLPAGGKGDIRWNGVQWTTPSTIIVASRVGGSKVYQVFGKNSEGQFGSSGPNRGLKGGTLKLHRELGSNADVGISPTGQHYVAVGYSFDVSARVLSVADVNSAKEIASRLFPKHVNPHAFLSPFGGEYKYTSTLFSPDSKIIALSLSEKGRSGEHTIELCRSSTWKPFATISNADFEKEVGTIGPFTHIGFSPDSRFLAAMLTTEIKTSRKVRTHRVLCLWKTEDGSLSYQIEVSTLLGNLSLDIPELVKFAPDGNSISVAHAAKPEFPKSGHMFARWAVGSWSTATGERRFLAAGRGSGGIFTYALSPDGTTFVLKNRMNQSEVCDITHLSTLQDAVRKGDAHWDQRQFKEALAEYLTVASDAAAWKIGWFVEDYLHRVWSRILDIYAQDGADSDARKMAQYALENDIPLSPSTDEGKNVVGKVVAERRAAADRERQSQTTANKQRLAEVRKRNQTNRVIASSVNKSEFIERLRSTMARGRIDDIATYAIFEDYSFQDTFGDPGSNLEWTNGRRLYSYRCSDGAVQLTILLRGRIAIVSGVNLY